MFVGNRV